MVKKQKGFFLKACFCVTNFFWSDCWRVQMGAQENGEKVVYILRRDACLMLFYAAGGLQDLSGPGQAL
jgi:hypothetical protein